MKFDIKMFINNFSRLSERECFQAELAPCKQYTVFIWTFASTQGVYMLSRQQFRDLAALR